MSRHLTLDPTATPPTGWWSSSDCDLDAFVALVTQQTDPADYPLAAEVVQNVLVYDAGRLGAVVSSPAGRRDAQAEIARAFAAGPGSSSSRAPIRTQAWWTAPPRPSRR